MLKQLTIILILMNKMVEAFDPDESGNWVIKSTTQTDRTNNLRLQDSSIVQTKSGSSSSSITSTGLILEPSKLGIKLDKCQGDCDDDSECKGNYKCFARLSTEKVPGCPDIPDADAGYDFCYDPSEEGAIVQNPELTIAGKDGIPEYAYPLGKCEGSCQSDVDCQDGLACFIRQGSISDTKTIPGCTGLLDEFGTQYCYDPSDSGVDVSQETELETSDSPTAASPEPTSSPKAAVRPSNVTATGGSSSAMTTTSTGIILNPSKLGIKLNKCQGDCDDDFECMGNYKCFGRLGTERVPGCPDISEADSGYDFCYDPADKLDDGKYPQLVLAGNDGVPDGVFPLSKCEGHCQRRVDCQDGLICFTRGGSHSTSTTVPGCVGLMDDFGTQYCYDPSDPEVDQSDASLPQLTPRPTATSTSIEVEGKPQKPTPKPNAKPFQQVAPPPIKPSTDDSIQSDDIPQADNGDYDSNFPSLVPVTLESDPSFSPSEQKTDSTVTRSPFNLDKPDTYFLPLQDPANDGHPQSAFPLSRCEGDCDGDSECADGLICRERNLFDPVPGCSGYGLLNSDYCIDPHDDPSVIPPTKTSFRIKMTWKKGYKWQEEKRERNWCLTCSEISCEVGDSLEVQPCGPINTFFEFTPSLKNKTQVSIQVAQTSLCTELVSSREIQLRECNTTARRQKFIISKGTDFEIWPAYHPGCLKQQHVPKNFEPIFKSTCEEARRTNTSLWHKYIPAGTSRLR